jgi:hypothetical protein
MVLFGMISSKAIDLVRTFSADEFKEFGLFLESPFHIKDKILVKLYEVIKNYYPGLDSKKFTKENLFKKIYPGKDYNDTRMRNLLSDFLQAGLQYLSTVQVLSEDFKKNVKLMEELINKEQVSLFEKNYQKAQATLDSEKILDADYFENKYLLGKMDLAYKNITERQGARIDEIKIEIYESLRIFFLLRAMYLETEVSTSARDRFSYGKNPKQREELERYIDMEAEEHSSIVYVRYYYNMYKLGRTQEKKYYYELRDIIKNHYESLNEVDKRNIFTALTNHCYFAANKGETEFLRDHFELYRENLEKGYYAMGKYLTHLTYINTVVTGLEVKEFKWVDGFIEDYKKELDIDKSENAYTFCRALFFYHAGEYEKALERAADVKSEDFAFKHQLKSLYLKIYYDMNEVEPFYSNIDGYKHFINSERYVTAPTKPVFLNYINFAKKLFDIKNRIDEKDYDFAKLKREVLNEKAMINKPWLLRKIEEIENFI